MNRKIWKALGIVVCMLALAAPHAMAETITHMVTADTHFADVVKNINASGVDDENVIELCVCGYHLDRQPYIETQHDHQEQRRRS